MTEFDQRTEAEALGAGLVAISKSFDKALELQSQSLSIPLLRDVLVPIVMRLFSFFAFLVVTLIGGILGLKWLAGDLLK